MKKLEIAQATAPLSEYAQTLANEPVVLTHNGKPVAALLPINDIDMETLILSTDSDFVAIIERSRVRQKAEGGISSDEMRRRLGLKKSA